MYLKTENMKEQQIREHHSLKEWVLATRPWSFPASAMPVAVTLAYLFWRQYDVNWTCGVWALLNIIVFHAAGNTWSDYFDFVRGVDASDTYGVRILTDGLFTPREIRRLSLALLAVAAAAGVGLMIRTGWPLLWIGLGGLGCTLLYPPLKYRAWGDLVIAVAYAWLPMWGTSFVAIGHIDMSVLLLAVPVGMITVAILHANNTRDVLTDARAHITTLAMKLGVRASVLLYGFWTLFPFLFVALCLCLGRFPLWSLLTFVALPQALSHSRLMNRCPSSGSAVIARLDEATAKLQLLFSMLLALSFILAAWWS